MSGTKPLKYNAANGVVVGEVVFQPSRKVNHLPQGLNVKATLKSKGLLSRRSNLMAATLGVKDCVCRWFSRL